LLSVAVYRIWLHPLSKYPGPPLWSTSRIPLSFYFIRGTLPYRIQELHNQYGPVVRIAPSELSYTTEDAWADIYGKQPGMPQLRKDPNFVNSFQKDAIEACITAVDEFVGSNTSIGCARHPAGCS
jgi:hypothetical protein